MRFAKFVNVWSFSQLVYFHGIVALDLGSTRFVDVVYEEKEVTKKVSLKGPRGSRSISVKVLVALEVGAVAVASPAGVLKLDTHSSSEGDPSESSLPPVSIAPMVLPFQFLDDSVSDTEIPERHVSPTPHDAMLSRWRSRVASRSSSPTTSTPEIPTAPIPPAPSAVVAPSTDIISPVDAPPGIH
ncbi:hypothetical protein Tco_0794355 [Tanacetum coccineum]